MFNQNLPIRLAIYPMLARIGNQLSLRQPSHPVGLRRIHSAGKNQWRRIFAWN